MWYLFCYKFGLDTCDAFEFVLFFAHQCNSTVTIVTAMMCIITKLNERSSWSMYNMLAKVCLKVNPYKKNKEKDVGSGSHNRHSPSSNATLNVKDRKGILK